MTKSALPEVIPAPSIHEVPRPVIQRRELGPIVHSWGTLVLEEMAEGDIARSALWQSLQEMDNQVERSVRTLDTICRKAVGFAVRNHLSAADVVSEWLCGPRLTHNTHLTMLLEEGMTSAIWFPFNAFTSSQKQDELDSRDPSASSSTAHIQDFAETLRREDFRDCMVQAGHTANGLWGLLSSAARSTLSYRKLLRLVDNFFDADELEHGRYALSANTRTAMADHRLEANISEVDKSITATHSGGCPVRHRGFPDATIGTFARDYLTRHGLPMPAIEGPSLIEDALTVQADLLDRLISGMNPEDR